MWGTGRSGQQRDDSPGIDVRPGTDCLLLLVFGGEPRQHSRQGLDVETSGTREVISQTMVEQVLRIPRRSIFIEDTAQNVRLVGAVGRFGLS